MDPDFQRDFIWNVDKQSKLIEFVLMRIPLPVFYLVEGDQGRMIVVDGLQRLFNACEGHIEIFVAVAWVTAGRMGEIIRLEWDDIDLENEIITFRHNQPLRRTKNKKTRSIIVSKEILEFVLENKTKRGQ